MNSSSQQLYEIKEEYQSHLSDVNLLLYREHELRLLQEIYKSQLEAIEKMINKIEQAGAQSEISQQFQQKYLRKIVLQNSKTILSLQNCMKDKKTLTQQISTLKQQHKQYHKIILSEFQNSIQQKLSTIRGKVDELKKKIKEINKEIISLQQEHCEEIDQYSLNLKLLAQFQNKQVMIQKEIMELKERIN